MHTRSLTEISALLASVDASGFPELCNQLRGDTRVGAQRAIQRTKRRLETEAAEHERLRALAARECALLDAGALIVAGVDEVGRGALAGPVTACACVFTRDADIAGLNDSKKLSPQTRARLDVEIRSVAYDVSVAHVDSRCIDTLGIAEATRHAMLQALAGLRTPPDHVLVDGLPVGLGFPTTAVVSGDATVRAISAASIVAKVARDLLMVELDERYPGFGFAGNKGYGSADHLEAIRAHGPSPVHRLSFGPCAVNTLF